MEIKEIELMQLIELIPPTHLAAFCMLCHRDPLTKRTQGYLMGIDYMESQKNQEEAC